jgi:hypothetical protein
MPSKNDEDKVKVDTLLPKILNAQPPPNATLPKPTTTTTEETFYEQYDDPSDDDMPWSEEERFFLTEEYFFSKQLNHKFVARGYKRPVLTLRAETRRKYKNFRVTKREDKRQQERFTQQHIPNPVEDKPLSADSVIISTYARQKEDCPATTTTTTANTTASRQDPNPAGANKYLSVNQEKEYQDALRQTSNPILPAAGISLQQIMDMLNRDLTPEDYELLLRLDETVEKKTVAQETLTTLTEKTIDSEEHLTEVCTVCMFNYEMGDSVKYLPCKHFFHVDCIVPYLSNYGQACPVCKTKV